MTDKEKTAFKRMLKEKAIDILHAREKNAISAMNEAQQSANEVEKGSVGDKYETSRSMAQMDRDIHARQLESTQKDLSFIQQVDVSLFYSKVDAGAFVDTGAEKYFFLAGLGPVDVNGEKVFFLSIHSPIGKLFSDKKTGDKLIFNGKTIIISEVF